MSKKFAIVKGSVVDGIALADGPLETDGTWIDLEGVSPQPSPGWSYEDGVFTAPVLPEPPKMPPIITKVAFRFRLTDLEYIGIMQAAKTEIIVAAWVETFNMVSQINLDDERTIAGIRQLVEFDLLTDNRAEEILTAAVQPNERP